MNGIDIAMPTAEQINATFVELRCAITPHTTLPRAIPPWKVIRYVPSARAYTHPGTESCTDTFSVDIVVVQAKPAPISVAIATAGICTNASSSRVAT